ncbi:MAG: ChbG/HpnK family deacetylase [Candidatus Rokubacteria bacterium]|nr:ChbG/HpnK family deacetylase [Candidatus Rokubacteria bacterium]
MTLADRLLLVNADDFGLTAGVSRGILEAHRRGIVSSTTALVNLPAEAALDAEAAGLRSLGLGLHVNLSWGAPLSPVSAVASLVDESGRFSRDLRRLEERAEPDHVRRELEAQLEAFARRFGRPPTHLDSHHHVHRLTGVAEIVLDVALAARLPLRSQDPGFREGLRRRGARTPDHFLGGDSVEPYWTAARLLDTLAGLPVGVTELMCHPGRYDEALAYSRYGKQRETELGALCDPEARATVERLGIRLGHFGMLPAP